jgi:biotin transport system substrate-specific component
MKKRKLKTRELLLAGLYTALTALGASVKIPVPLVPISLQTLFPMLAGSTLPPFYAALSQVAYLLLGLMGLPVFVHGGGPAYVLQPTFGYLLALPLAAFLISRMSRKNTRSGSIIRIWFLNMIGAVFILFLGAIWLYINVNFVIGKSLPPEKAVIAGALIFLPGDVIKALVAAVLARVVKMRLKQTEMK